MERARGDGVRCRRLAAVPTRTLDLATLFEPAHRAMVIAPH
jgi:hypothetical protein